MRFSGVPADYLHLVWDKVEPFLARATERGREYGTEDILKALLQRNMQMWVAYEGETFETADIFAVCITEIIITPRRKACSILIGTGKRREEWQGFRSAIEQWAREQGCEAMKVIARPGWERVFTDYRKTHTLLEKAL